MNNISSDETIRKIDLGFPDVAKAAIEKARQTKTKLVVWRDGKVVTIDPEEALKDEAKPCTSNDIS